MKLQTETGIQLSVWNPMNFKQRYLSNFGLDSKFGRKKSCIGRQGIQHLFRKFGQNSKYFGIYRVLNAGANSEIWNSVYVFEFWSNFNRTRRSIFELYLKLCEHQTRRESFGLQLSCRKCKPIRSILGSIGFWMSGFKTESEIQFRVLSLA